MGQITVRQTTLDGVLAIERPPRFEDFRGHYTELYNRDQFVAAGIDLDFVEDGFSVSSRHVLRGLHGNDTTWKLISCAEGKFYLVVVNNDPDSSQYRQWEAFTLSETNGRQILVPPKFGNGHVVMSERAIFHYKQSETYDPASQFTLAWNDPALGIWWPVADPITSVRDAGLSKGP